MNKFCKIASLSLLTFALSSCGIFGDKDEELQPKELVDLDNTLKIKRLWNTKVGGGTESLLLGLRPVGDGSRIYAASHDGRVIALDPETGKSAWRSELELELSSGPAAGDGVVVVAAKDGYVISLDAQTGDEQWRANVAGEVLSKPVISDETIIVQTIDNRLVAIARYDGRQRWELEQLMPVLSMRGAASPMAVGSNVIAGFDNGRLVAVDMSSGDIEWDSMLSLPSGRSDLDRLSDIDGSIAVVGQDIYATGYQGIAAAVAAESGQIMWSREISSYVGMAADWNSTFTTRDDGEVIALNRSNGAELWRNDDLLRRDPTLPVPFHTSVVVGDFEGYLHFFSNIDGNPLARIRQGGDAISNPPVVVANRLYVQSDDGGLSAYEVVQDRPERSAPDTASTDET